MKLSGFSFEKGFSKILNSVEKYSPVMARRMAMMMVHKMSPFNSHLGGQLDIWTHTQASISVRHRRAIQNHLGGVHAGALFTLGESCAGLVLLKNFSPDKFRLILKSASVEYVKQARNGCAGFSQLEDKERDRLQLSLAKLETVLISMETVIKNHDGELLCTVRTDWQIKPWDDVRG
jgi:acyl-coenzyme A thioesterase PaaI-like protein